MRIFINGFGRIGRLAYRLLSADNNNEVVAVNDLTTPATLAYLLEFDSAQGAFHQDKISYTEKSIIVNGKHLQVLSERDPEKLPLRELGIDLVIESTGFFRSKELASKHLRAGAKKVVISAPAGSDVKTIVYNVNHKTVTASDNILSAASCTTNCLAPLVKALHNHFTILKGLMTTVHAVTNDQKILDLPHKDLRRGRSSLVNLIPTTTGAAAAIGLVIPELAGKLDGFAIRAPVVTGSIVDLTAEVAQHVTVKDVNEAMKEEANESFAYVTKPIVSTDIIGTSYGSLFDPSLTRAINSQNHTLVKVGAWYDNEMSYVSQFVRLVKYIAQF